MRSKTTFRRIGSVFPKDNPLAGLVWALGAVRSDLAFESQWIGRNDDNEVAAIHARLSFVHTYFFRGALRSLYSAELVLGRIASCPTWRDLARKHDVVEDFSRILKSLRRFKQEFNSFRNAVGGHMEREVEESLNTTDPAGEMCFELNDREGFGLQLSEYAVMHTLRHVSGAKDDDQDFNAKVRAMVSRMADATIACMAAADLVLTTWVQEYPFTNRKIRIRRVGP